MTVVVYSSPDLVSWTLLSKDAVPGYHANASAPGSPITTKSWAFFEPSVLYNKRTNTHVLWFVTQKNGGYGGQGVAVSRSGPAGPFEIDYTNGLPVRDTLLP